MSNPRRWEVTVTPGFLLAAATVFYFDGAVALLSGVAALLHELGHCGAIYAQGGRVCALRLSFVGAELALDPRRVMSYPQEIVAALAGPAVSLLVAFGAAQMGWFLLSGLSLALGLFNLLPAAQLDGGRALYAFAALLCSEQAAARLTRCVSAVSVGVLLGLGSAAAYKIGNFTLLITALWLFGGTLRENTQK